MVKNSTLEQLCAEKGLKMTDQRRTMIRAALESPGHFTAEELYQKLNGAGEQVSIATVYRSLKLFEDANVLIRHDFGEGRARYEETGEHHEHLIDIESGDVIEFHNEEIEALKERIARDLGYELVDHRLELYGRKIKS